MGFLDMAIDWIKDHSSQILTVVGIAGVIATPIVTIKCHEKALYLEEAAKEHEDDEFSIVDKIKVQAPAYAPLAAVVGVTVGTMLGAHILDEHKIQASVAAYTALAAGYERYKDKIRLLGGEQLEFAAEEAASREEVDKENGDPPWDRVQTFYFEEYGKFFEKTMEHVVLAEYCLNRKLAIDGEATVNDFLEMLDLEPVNGMDEIGWNGYDELRDYDMPWVDFAHRHCRMDDMDVCEISPIIPPHKPSEEIC